MMKWHPIETAPSGVDILVCVQSKITGGVKALVLADFGHKGWNYAGQFGYVPEELFTLTHWMKLPELPRTLNLPVKKIYFDQIKSGEKIFEFREKTPYWIKRIEGREFDFVEITSGYPRRDDMDRRMRFPWRGYEDQTIEHEHFGGKSVDVFAVRVGA